MEGKVAPFAAQESRRLMRGKPVGGAVPMRVCLLWREVNGGVPECRRFIFNTENLDDFNF